MSSINIILVFKTSYYTRWGHNLVISGPDDHFGQYDPQRAHWANCHHSGEELIWEATISTPLLPSITYKWALLDSDTQEIVRWEAHEHTVDLPATLVEGAVVEILDVWCDGSHAGHMLSRSAFTKVILRDKPPVTTKTLPPSWEPVHHEVIVRFQVWDWELLQGYEMCVTGGAPQLGNWQLQVPLLMAQAKTACWEAEVRIPSSAFPVTYKYAVRPVLSNGHVPEHPDIVTTSMSLEHGESRLVAIPTSESGKAPSIIVHNDGDFRRERRWRGAGVATPVFSLRSSRSVGSGDFRDLQSLVDWASAAGLRMIQILPISDTSVRGTWRDSYPYSSLCVCSLHPLYLSLEDLCYVEGDNKKSLPSSVIKDIEKVRKVLETLPEVDYEGTMAAKLRIARSVFDEVGSLTLISSGFQQFVQDNSWWIHAYAAFCFLQQLFGTSEHWKWGVFSSPTAQVMNKILSPDAQWHDSIQFTYYVQYQLHCQLLRASKHAASKRIALKGDLPIGVDKQSVDTWLYPSLFRMNVSTGAPPDYFDPGGQNWGFPTYNWEEMSKDGYDWWKKRLAHMGRYFHSYRIDHILGFFRIWEIPGDCSSGLLGRFRPSVPVNRHAHLESQGIWDIDRLTDPYVTAELLEQVFGSEHAAKLSKEYFEAGPPGTKRLKFKKENSSEGAIAALDISDDSIKQGLLTLRRNVLLLRDPQSNDPSRPLYPRINLSSTSSFEKLTPTSWQKALAALHDDHFYHWQDEIWREQALKTLPVLLAASDMMVCGEDLGMIPACVHPIMAELGLVGLRIERMPSEPGQEFGNPAAYPYYTVASPSSHDTTTTRGWYEDLDDEKRQRYWADVLGGDGPAPPIATPEIVSVIVSRHCDSPSILAIFPLQDVMAISPAYAKRPANEETINDPTNPHHYWRYRMHVKIEDLMKDKGLLSDVQGCLLFSGRCRQDDLLDV